MPVDLEAINSLMAKYESLSGRERRSYKEADTRTNFIDHLFAALGWDVYDRHEVEREPMTRSGFADYAFKMGGVVRFYLEAKPLEDNLYKEDYARKAITYAYNKGVPWAVLCSFAGLQVFNAEWETTDLNKARVVNLTWQDYSAADSPLLLLSRDAFSEGELEKHAQKWGGMKPRLPVEKSLFEQMRHWRGNLFSQIKAYRADLSLDQVDEAVLRLLNRLIFIRSCEDRHIEETKLRTALNEWAEGGYQPQLVEVLRSVFSEFDVNYDSDLFNLALADQVFVESIALRDIISGLYAPPRSLAAYDFSVMDADVLGQVYEQYLGYVATEVKTEAAKQRSLSDMGFEVEQQEFEAKRVKRKAHGIYYTPKWVVDYVINQTVGRYLEEHNHDDILNMTILDPSCGSGSFLIDAFETLLAYHAQVEGKSPRDLGKARRWQILTENIFGVDLDQQAVDIARLNLLLRAVARRELLPGLQDNVVCGNSLISGSREELRRYFGRRWQEKHAFGWDDRFERVMERGGFDVIVGNPPYVRIQTLDRKEVDYYNDTYNAATGNYDIYCLFVEKGLQLLRPGGRLGFIVPNKFFSAAYGKGLRRLLSEAEAVEQIVDFGEAQVFESGTNYTCLLFLKKAGHDKVVYVPASKAGQARANGPDLVDAERHRVAVQHASLGAGPWVLTGGRESALMEKMSAAGRPLSAVTSRIFQGLKTGADRVYVLTVVRRCDSITEVRPRIARKDFQLEADLLKPLIKGAHMRRYHVEAPSQVVLFPYRDGTVISGEEMKDRYPLCWKYLLSCRSVLDRREHGLYREGNWHGYSRIQALEVMGLPKIITPDLAASARYSYDDSGSFYFSGGAAGGYGIIVDIGVNARYVLGVLNSRAADWLLRNVSTKFRGGYSSYESRFIGRIPIPQAGARATEAVASSVDRILELHARLLAKGDAHDEERARIEREIEDTDHEIDDLVYHLYGLTQAERAIVEKEFERPVLPAPPMRLG